MEVLEGKSDDTDDTQEEDHNDNACFQLVDSRGKLKPDSGLLIGCCSFGSSVS